MTKDQREALIEMGIFAGAALFVFIVLALVGADIYLDYLVDMASVSAGCPA